MAKPFAHLEEREILALAISLEEEDARIYGDFAARLAETFPETAATLRRMQEEETGHAARFAG